MFSEQGMINEQVRNLLLPSRGRGTWPSNAASHADHDAPLELGESRAASGTIDMARLWRLRTGESSFSAVTESSKLLLGFYRLVLAGPNHARRANWALGIGHSLVIGHSKLMPSS